MTPQLLAEVVVAPTISGRVPPSKNVVRMACDRVSARAVLVGEDEVDEGGRTDGVAVASVTIGTPLRTGRSASKANDTRW